jgi:hypothetical protein
MSPFQRLQRLCPWKPHAKKGLVKDHHHLKIPQYVGNPGWILLTHNEESMPVAMFVDRHDIPIPISIVMDERLFSDTVIRVVQLKPDLYIACDIRYLNGRCVYNTMPYSERTKVLAGLVDAFHQTDLTAVLLDAPQDTLIHGWEYYDEEPGTMGVFLPAKE